MFASHQHYNSGSFSDEPDLNILYRYNIVSYNIFRSGSLNSMSAF